MPVTYENIATFSPTGSNVTFTSIPSTYTDLRVVVAGSFTNSDQINIRLNDNGSAIYSFTRILGNGSTATSDRGGGTSRWLQPTAMTTSPFLFEMDIFSYANTSVFKTLLMNTSNDQNGSGVTERQVCLFASTSAINRIELQTQNFWNYSSGTTATLYGIKNA